MIYYFLCFRFLKQCMERNRVSYMELNLELPYKYRLQVDKIPMQTARSLARGINSKNEPECKVYCVSCYKAKKAPLISKSGSEHDNFLREGGKEEHFFP